jgi:predicted ATPase
MKIIVTGKQGCGKTTVIQALQAYLGGDFRGEPLEFEECQESALPHITADRKEFERLAYLAALEGRSADPGMAPADADTNAAEAATLAVARFFPNG